MVTVVVPEGIEDLIARADVVIDASHLAVELVEVVSGVEIVGFAVRFACGNVGVREVARQGLAYRIQSVRWDDVVGERLTCDGSAALDAGRGVVNDDAER